ncbi:unnamed protein product [Rhodiola kirilowii]
MVDSRTVMEQFHEIHHILGQFAQRSLKMDESISVSSIIDKLPPAWKDFQRTLKHKKKEMSLVELATELRMEEELRARERNTMEIDPNLPKVNVLEASSQKVNKNKGKKRPNGYASNGPNKKHPSKAKRMLALREKRGISSEIVGQERGITRRLKAMLLVLKMKSRNLKDDEISWWVDSGATAYLYRDKEIFKSFVTTSEGRVLHMGHESTAPIIGKGQVELEFSSGKNTVLANVLCVPNIRKNIISGGVFVGKGYLCNGMFKISINEVVSSLYMNCEHDISIESMNLNDDVSTLWHARLEHVHYKRLHEMSKHDLIPSFDVNIDKCRLCMLTKITRQPFHKVERESNILDLIHSDLCDFHASPSLGNKKYVVTYIDDCSRFCYVYLLHSKDEALDKFKIYNSEVELQKRISIKKLRTDKGGEYFNPSYFQSVGIIHETTAPYTPHQNGVSERKNRALKEMVTAMLSYSGLNDGFWREVMLTACYLLNRVPNKRGNITPYEIWFNKKPSLNHIRVWGCRAIVRLPIPKHKTLGEKGVEFIFIGYAHHSLAYRFYVIEPNKHVSIHTIIESRDAIFDEKRFSSISMPKDLNLVPNANQDSNNTQIFEIRRSKRTRKEKSFENDFHIYLVEGARDEVSSQYMYCHVIESDPKTIDEAMKSQDVSFWKEVINDEIDSIIENNT